MQLVQDNKKVVRSGEFTETNFGIRNTADLVHIFSVLRNKMYTNKVLAVMREYSTNAYDAHIAAGKPDLPIEVSLPTQWDPYFVVRDFGTGLSEEDVREVYCMYGASTKRNSNDFNGQLGFGSKSAFSYCESFQITSYLDGTEITFEAYLDESGLGTISKLQQKATSESNGVRITVPVKEIDISSFHSTARNLYKYFKVVPSIKNLGNDPIATDEAVFQGDDWRLIKADRYSYKSVAIMGNVGYPLDMSMITPHLSTDESDVARLPLELNFAIGDLSIAASREGLEYDKRTVKAVVSKLKKAFADLVLIAHSTIESCDDVVEFKRVMDNWARTVNIKIPWKFQGVPVTSVYLKLPDLGSQAVTNDPKAPKETRLYVVDRYDNRPDTASGVQKAATVTSGENIPVLGTAYLLRDTADKPVRRIKSFFLENSDIKTVYVFSFFDSVAKEKFLEESFLKDRHFTNLSKIEPAAAIKGTSGSKRISGKFFKLDYQSSYYGRAISTHWTALSDDEIPEEPIYVILNRFSARISLTSMYSYEPREFNTLVRNLSQSASLKMTNLSARIVALRDAQDLSALEKLADATPVSLSEFLRNEMVTRFRTNPGVMANLILRDSGPVMFGNRRAFELLQTILGHKSVRSTEFFNEFKDFLLDKDGSSSDSDFLLSVIRRDSSIKDIESCLEPKEAELKEKSHKLGSKYPLLKHVYPQSYIEEPVEACIDYIKMIERTVTV